MTEETTGVLEKELAGVNEQIVRLEKYKTALNAALEARLDLDGFISADTPTRNQMERPSRVKTRYSQRNGSPVALVRSSSAATAA